MKNKYFCGLVAALFLTFLTSSQAAPYGNPEFTANAWYKGDVGGTPIWLYISTFSGTYIGGFYGYESQKGASLEIRGQIEGDKVELSYERYDKPYKESFLGTLNRSTGKIEGEWKNDKKTLTFHLEPASIPCNTAQDFLDNIATEKTFVDFPDYSIGFTVPDFKSCWLEKKHGAYVANLSTFLHKIQKNVGNSEDLLELPSQSGVVFCKTPLENNQWLVFFSINTETASEVNYAAESTEQLLCAAILDAKGTCLQAIRLGNDGEDSYFMDFSCKQTSANQLLLTWSFYMREDNARQDDGEVLKTIEIKNGRFVEK